MRIIAFHFLNIYKLPQTLSYQKKLIKRLSTKFSFIIDLNIIVSLELLNPKKETFH